MKIEFTSRVDKVLIVFVHVVRIWFVRWDEINVMIRSSIIDQAYFSSHTSNLCAEHFQLSLR